MLIMPAEGGGDEIPKQRNTPYGTLVGLYEGCGGVFYIGVGTKQVGLLESSYNHSAPIVALYGNFI